MVDVLVVVGGGRCGDGGRASGMEFIHLTYKMRWVKVIFSLFMCFPFCFIQSLTSPSILTTYKKPT